MLLVSTSHGLLLNNWDCWCWGLLFEVIPETVVRFVCPWRGYNLVGSGSNSEILLRLFLSLNSLLRGIPPHLETLRYVIFAAVRNNTNSFFTAATRLDNLRLWDVSHLRPVSTDYKFKKKMAYQPALRGPWSRYWWCHLSAPKLVCRGAGWHGRLSAIEWHWSPSSSPWLACRRVNAIPGPPHFYCGSHKSRSRSSSLLLRFYLNLKCSCI